MGATWDADPVVLTRRGERALAVTLAVVIVACLALAFITGQAAQCDRLLDEDTVSAQRIVEVCGGTSASRSWS